MKFLSVFLLAILALGAFCIDESKENIDGGAETYKLAGSIIRQELNQDNEHIRQRRWGYYGGYGGYGMGYGMRGYGGMGYGMGYPMWG